MNRTPGNHEDVSHLSAAELRRERLRAEMREEILGAARQIVSERGASALTMRAVAERIGYSTGAIYEYFSSKDELCTAMFFQGSEGLAGRLREAIDTLPEGSSVLERLEASGRAYRDFARQYQDLYLLIFSRQSPLNHTDFRSGLQEDQAFSTMLRLVSEGIVSGELRPVEPLDGAFLLWSWIHGFVMLELTGHIPNEPPELADQLFDQGRMLVVGGLIAWGA